MTKHMVVLLTVFSLLLNMPSNAQVRVDDECPVLSQSTVVARPEDTQVRPIFLGKIETIDGIDPDVVDSILYRVGQYVGDYVEKRIRFNWAYAYRDPCDETIFLRMCFTFSDKANGLGGYDFEVVAGDMGESVKVLDMPYMFVKQEKGRIIPCSAVVKLADQKGIPKNKRQITFDYDPITDSFVWLLFDNRMKRDKDEWSDGRPTVKVIAIQAHTGNVLRVYEAYQ